MNKIKAWLRQKVLWAETRTELWFVTPEMHTALDEGDLETARKLLKEKEKEWPNSDPKLVGYGVMITFFDNTEQEG